MAILDDYTTTTGGMRVYYEPHGTRARRRQERKRRADALLHACFGILQSIGHAPDDSTPFQLRLDHGHSVGISHYLGGLIADDNDRQRQLREVLMGLQDGFPPSIGPVKVSIVGDKLVLSKNGVIFSKTKDRRVLRRLRMGR